MKTFTTRASYEAVAKFNLEVVGKTARVANDAAEFGLGTPSHGDIHPQELAIVRIPVDPDQCANTLGRQIASIVTSATGDITITCLTKTEQDKTINGTIPGTPEHAILVKTWGVKPEPIRHRWSGWTNICQHPAASQKAETGAEYFDRMAHAIAGHFINEDFTVEVH